MTTTSAAARVINRRGTEIRIGQTWADNSPTRDPIRHFTITDLEATYGNVQAVCHITHGIDRITGEKVSLDRVVRIDIDRMHPTRTGYRLTTPDES
ncbi:MULTISPECIES: hypothetical protein [Rhodococcus]|jgi:hypothetical protein|uniref:hypothetical protein n=1 Tax=Rhodococcus TaxID=1827 RepID=UPI00110DC3B8|nr:MULTISPECIES: hypothetical protein [Rhodococcus]MCF8786170.1 hypothetical protein [Rhodococcus ruber]UTM40250.1 hypothetical protein MX572_25425 [Rhodococcus pyridinivorans]WAL49699.1 hypothetical protein OQN32_27185 [Rhodococcus pyridinivorans]